MLRGRRSEENIKGKLYHTVMSFAEFLVLIYEVDCAMSNLEATGQVLTPTTDVHNSDFILRDFSLFRFAYFRLRRLQWRHDLLSAPVEEAKGSFRKYISC